MKNLIPAFLATLLSVFPLMAQDDAATAAQLRWNGSLQTDDRVHAGRDTRLFFQEYRLALKAETKTERSRFFAETWVRGLGYPEIQSFDDLFLSNKANPSGISLREAYFDIYGLCGNHLDLRIGRQRIAWGTADKMNPTDNINPDDLEDLFDFGRHLGSDGIKASLYLGSLTITAVAIPAFKPAVLPAGDLGNALGTAPKIPAGVTLANAPIVTPVLPEPSFKKSVTAGIKAAGKLMDFDVSASYLYCHDDFPVVQTNLTVAARPATPLSPLPVSARVNLVYPPMHVAGADVSGQLFGAGVWAEAALFFPENVMNTMDLGLVGMGIQTSPALKNDPYLKWVLGADYHFPADLYLNLQWVHGFVNERGSEIENYLMGNLEWTVLNGKLKISPLGIGLEMKSFDSLSASYGLVGQPQLIWYPVDNAELCIGAHLVDGKAGTRFGAIRERDEVFLKTKYSF